MILSPPEPKRQPKPIRSGSHKDETTLPLSSLRDSAEVRANRQRGRSVTRFKGLGEMDAEELWKTSMDPANRVLLQVTMDDANAADGIFRRADGRPRQAPPRLHRKAPLDLRNLISDQSENVTP